MNSATPQRTSGSSSLASTSSLRSRGRARAAPRRSRTRRAPRGVEPRVERRPRGRGARRAVGHLDDAVSPSPDDERRERRSRSASYAVTPACASPAVRAGRAPRVETRIPRRGVEHLPFLARRDVEHPHARDGVVAGPRAQERHARAVARDAERPRQPEVELRVRAYCRGNESSCDPGRHGLRDGSPVRTMPPRTTRAFMPRSLAARPRSELTNRRASGPNRAENFAQPRAASRSPRARPIPTLQPGAGWKVLLHRGRNRRRAGRPPAANGRPVPGEQRDAAGVHQGDLGLGRRVRPAAQRSPTKPRPGSIRASVSTSRSPSAGRRTTISTLPSSRGDPSTCGSHAQSRSPARNVRLLSPHGRRRTYHRCVRAWLLHDTSGPRPYRLGDVATPEPAGGEVRVHCAHPR